MAGMDIVTIRIWFRKGHWWPSSDATPGMVEFEDTSGFPKGAGGLLRLRCLNGKHGALRLEPHSPDTMNKNCAMSTYQHITLYDVSMEISFKEGANINYSTSWLPVHHRLA